MNPQGGYYDILYLGLGQFFRFKILNFNIFLGFQKKIFFGV